MPKRRAGPAFFSSSKSANVRAKKTRTELMTDSKALQFLTQRNGTPTLTNTDFCNILTCVDGRKRTKRLLSLLCTANGVNVNHVLITSESHAQYGCTLATAIKRILFYQPMQWTKGLLKVLNKTLFSSNLLIKKRTKLQIPSVGIRFRSSLESKSNRKHFEEQRNPDNAGHWKK